MKQAWKLPIATNRLPDGPATPTSLAEVIQPLQRFDKFSALADVFPHIEQNCDWEVVYIPAPDYTLKQGEPFWSPIILVSSLEAVHLRLMFDITFYEYVEADDHHRYPK